MTKDDIFRMAREANLPECHTTHPKALERFAALVAEHERDALTNKIIDKVTNKISKMLEEKFHE